MLEKSLDEILGKQGEVSQFLGLVIAIAKSHFPILKSFQSTVGDPNSEDIAGQVVEDLLSGTSVPAVDVPFLIPARATGVQEPKFSQAIFDLGPEDLTQGISRDQEIGMVVSW